jgi:ribosome-associated translation inhibitor RaiA
MLNTDVCHVFKKAIAIFLGKKYMIIEINSSNSKLSKATVKAIEKKAMKLSRFSEKISKVDIFLSEENSPVKENKSCKIRLDIFGDSLFAQKTTASFETAATSVIRVLKLMLKEKTGQRNVPSDEIISTVNI